MDLPYTREQFFDVFGAYNAWLGVWGDVALGGSLLAAPMVLAGHHVVFKRGGLIVLAAVWALMGAGYHIAFFAEINPVAIGFGVAFLLQAALLILAAILARPNQKIPWKTWQTWAGVAVTIYAALIYAGLGQLLGRPVSHGPRLGSSPCPTVILTLGCIIVARLPRYLLVVPVCWAVIGTSAIWLFGVYEDAGLPVAAALAILATVFKQSVREDTSSAPQFSGEHKP